MNRPQGYRGTIKRYLSHPRAATARRTQRYGSGRVAFRKGQPLAVVCGEPYYVYNAGATQADADHGKGLLYTYDSRKQASKYVEEE